jgi:hypothetical protein
MKVKQIILPTFIIRGQAVLAWLFGVMTKETSMDSSAIANVGLGCRSRQAMSYSGESLYMAKQNKTGLRRFYFGIYEIVFVNGYLVFLPRYRDIHASTELLVFLNAVPFA